jgi:hypothetical protein
MYQEKLALAVKHNGRVLRELGDTVFLPFGCEYTLHFKNLNSVRALVRVEIDGQDVTEGTSLIVPPNGTVELERFIKAGNLASGNKLKFIERTAKIEDGPRGIKVEDGLIRVEFEFERLQPKVDETIIKRTYIDEWQSTRWPRYPLWNGPYYTSYSSTAKSADLQNGAATSDEIGGGTLRSMATTQNATFNMASAKATLASEDQNLSSSATVGQLQAVAGITVPGSESDQSFTVGAWFPTDGQKHVMVLKLMGKVGEEAVQAPVTVKTKTECSTCGTVSKFGTKFCPECGTSLKLI